MIDYHLACRDEILRHRPLPGHYENRNYSRSQSLIAPEEAYQLFPETGVSLHHQSRYFLRRLKWEMEANPRVVLPLSPKTLRVMTDQDCFHQSSSPGLVLRLLHSVWANAKIP